MKRRNYRRILAWLSPANVETFYRTVEAHRRQRVDAVKARADQRRQPVEPALPL